MKCFFHKWGEWVIKIHEFTMPEGTPQHMGYLKKQSYATKERKCERCKKEQVKFVGNL